MSEPNYITPVGLDRIRRELEWLQKIERPKVVREVAFAASLGDRSENAEYIYGKKRLREIDRRMGFLIGRLNHVQPIDPGQLTGKKVMFGATVTLMDGDDEKTWRIYGEDEVNVAAGILSWKSPLARALAGHVEGDAVRVSAPAGVREVEIVEVRFEAQEALPADWAPDRLGGGPA